MTKLAELETTLHLVRDVHGARVLVWRIIEEITRQQIATSLAARRN